MTITTRTANGSQTSPPEGCSAALIRLPERRRCKTVAVHRRAERIERNPRNRQPLIAPQRVQGENVMVWTTPYRRAWPPIHAHPQRVVAFLRARRDSPFADVA